MCAGSYRQLVSSQNATCIRMANASNLDPDGEVGRADVPGHVAVQVVEITFGRIKTINGQEAALRWQAAYALRIVGLT
jgi:hypothetical protein